MKKNNKNLCSIFHKRFIKLKEIIQCPRKAQLMDYILLGWQTSSYKLKNSNNKWFMKAYAEITTETAIPISTLQRYIKELDEEGFIVRRQALYSRKNEAGEFIIKKGNYIHPTEKLLSLIKSESKYCDQPDNSPQDNPETQNDAVDNSTNDCSNNGINEGTDPLRSRGSYISDLDNSLNNNINSNPFKKIVNKNNKTKEQHRKQQQFDIINNFLKNEIKEEVSDEVKSLVIATFCNLIFEKNKYFSNPKQTVAEYLWSLFNIKYCMPYKKGLVERNHALSSLIQKDEWRTPKGFFKYSWLGNQFKKPVDNEQDWKNEKEREISNVNLAKTIAGASKQKKETISDEEYLQLSKKLAEIEYEISQSGSQLSDLETSGCSDEELINSLRHYLQHLYEQQKEIEEQLGDDLIYTHAA